MTKFFDTCALLSLQEKVYGDNEIFYISSITLQELERIKTSYSKDEETKYKARKALHLLVEHEGNYQVIIYDNDWDNGILNRGIQLNDDARIIYTAYKTHPEAMFITDDLSCKMIASKIFRLNVEFKKDNVDNYTGYKEVILSNEELANFYSVILPNDKNIYNLMVNEYLLLKIGNQCVDIYKWNNKYIKVNHRNIESKMFGKIVPKDEFQKMVIDSLYNNQLTVIRGRAGSGKSLLGLSYLFYLLERGQIDKIVMLVNPVATKDSCKFGFLPGTFLEKVLGSQIGHFLSSKIGGIEYVYQLIEQRRLEFIALADARGYDTSGMNCALYMTESQNTSIEQMKLVLSRIGEDTICVIEGDNLMQTDIHSCEGNNNGLKRICEVYKGEEYFGAVTLEKCYRSRIAEKIDEM